jgi:predicted MFS family arabinose efflux permease
VLWSIWLGANICVWMTEVAAAWLMTSLTSSALMVSLVQTAVTLPVFLLALPGGALADVINRRLGLVLSQAWLAVVAGLVTAQMMTGSLTPWSLLALMFASGMATALRWPVFNAIVPEIVVREQLASALTLHAMAMNGARVFGPMLAGFVVAAWGTTWVFAIVCVLSLGSVLVLVRWPYRAAPTPEHTRHLLPAIRDGLNYILRHPERRAVILQCGLVYMAVTSLLALLPLVANSLRPGDAGLYASLAASGAVGAICVGPFLHRTRQRYSSQTIVTCGTLVVAAGVLGVSAVDHVGATVVLLFITGAGWLSAGNTLSVTLQSRLADAFRARGMSVFLMSMMVGGALGSASFGALADLIGPRGSLASMAGVLACLAILLRLFASVDSRPD